MKKNIFIVLSTLVLGLTSCSDEILDRQPLSGPASSKFFSSKDELTLAINGAYTSLYWMSDQDVSYQLYLEGATDLAYIRGSYANMNVIQAGESNAQTGVFASVWDNFYEKIARCNNILDNMYRAKDRVSDTFYNQIKAQALFLRAYSYHYLVFLYGDVPYITHMEAYNSKPSKTSAAKIIEHLYADLDTAYAYLPENWGTEDCGRVTKGCAMGLKARIALYNKDYDIAQKSAYEVIKSKVYSISPSYKTLFFKSGSNSLEAMLFMPFLNTVQTNANPKYIGTRSAGCYSIIVPTQTLVDMYQCKDGKRIDQSPLYDPAKPFDNRDPRLDYTIIHPGSWYTGYRFETHPDSTKTSAYINGVLTRVANLEVTNAYATFTGYVGKKYFDEADVPDYISQSELSFMLMRYAEVLLTYAEAKVELGSIDQSVIDAINQVRQRADVNMPAASLSLSQEEMRNLVHYERTIEFAMEGLRLFDIRRWKIAEYVLPGNLLGRRVKAHWNDNVVPAFNQYGKPAYPDESIFNKIGYLNFYPSKNYLWPIPQSEIDLNPKLAEAAE